MKFKDSYGYLKMGWWMAIAISATLAVIGALMAVALTASNHQTHVACKRVHEETGLSTKVRGKMEPTCFVEVRPGMWIKADQVRLIG